MQGKHIWMFVPVGLLLLSATIGAITVFVALNDPGFGVEEDYYQKGLDHDAALEQARRNQELGWVLKLEAAVVEGAPLSPGTLRLRDRDGAPIAGARVSLEAFPVARSAERIEAELAEAEAGVYRAELPLRRTGKWEFRFRVVAAGEVYTSVQQPFLFLQAPAAG